MRRSQRRRRRFKTVCWRSPIPRTETANICSAVSPLKAQPYTLSATGATYNGDQGQRQVQIAAGQTITDSDNGNAVFEQIKTGNGTFVASAASSNTGTGVLGVTSRIQRRSIRCGQRHLRHQLHRARHLRGSRFDQCVDQHGVVHRRRHDCLRRRAGDTERPACCGRFVRRRTQRQSKPVHHRTESGHRAATGCEHLGEHRKAEQFDCGRRSTTSIRRSITCRMSAPASAGGSTPSRRSSRCRAASKSSCRRTSRPCRAWITPAPSRRSTQQNTTLSAALQAYSLTQGLSLFKYL